MSKIKVAVLGATGNVGQRIIQLLENHPWFELVSITASDRSVGKKYREAANWRLNAEIPEYVKDLVVAPTDPKGVDESVKLVFSALPSDIARAVEPEFAKAGFYVSSNASAYRMEKDVPLIIPEVNPDHLGLLEIQRETRKWRGALITDPNCTVIQLAISLKPLMQFGIKRVHAASMQAVSGAGYDGVASMAILDNLIPYIANEEEKVQTEPLKILGTFNGREVEFAKFSITASCHRVPVLDGHTIAVWVEMEEEPGVEEVIKAFRSFKSNLNLPTSPEELIQVRMEVDRPQPRLDRDAGRGMTVTVGRIRKSDIGIKYICLGHNTIRGAAGAALLNGELLVREKKL
ncbi:MAG: aspartate-semialdehyde dehydrogenase [Methanocellales archaeon]